MLLIVDSCCYVLFFVVLCYLVCCYLLLVVDMCCYVWLFVVVCSYLLVVAMCDW